MKINFSAALCAAGLLAGCGDSALPPDEGKASVPGAARRVAVDDCENAYGNVDENGGALPVPAARCAATIGTTADGTLHKAFSRPHVVVADLDSAFNPYHSFFYETQSRLLKSPIYPQGSPPSSVTPEVLAAFGVDEDHILEVTRTGKFAQDIKADEALWSRVKPREIYWFRGTNVLAVSYATDALPPLKPIADKNEHGTGTSASVLFSNPDAIILFVEAWDTLGNRESHDFAFKHPLVDILTTSYGKGLPFQPIGTGLFHPELSAFFASFTGVVRMGKLHFSSGGNSPGFTPGRAGAGPWWSIGVSGVEEEDGSESRTATAGLIPDFVSDFTQSLPYCLNCESGLSSVGGTSFSTPRSAGLASKVLLETRRALGHTDGIVDAGGKPAMAAGAGRAVSNWDIRRALEEAAHVPKAADAPAAGIPINDQAPWTEIGWGDLSADPAKGVVAEALAALGFGARQRSKDAGFCDFQTKVIEYRKAYWNNLSPLAEQIPDADVPVVGGTVGDHVGYSGDPAEPLDEDPFIYCGSGLPSP